jgi:cytochrome oxidase assembly protein ShyY1
MSDAGPPYLRTARSPRMIGLLVLLLAIAAVCGRLGMWQLDRARQGAAERPDVPVAAALTGVLAPQAAFPGDLAGRVVTARGAFGDDEVMVTRHLDGVPGVLVVSPLVVEETGAVLAVVRGWAPDAAQAAEVPAPPGVVDVRGRLEPGEAAREADGEVTAISPAQLVNRWGGPMYSGYLVLEDVSPAQAPGLELVPAPEPASGFDLQNLAYALQWWLFGGFAVLLWLRMVRDEARRVVAEAGTEAGDEAGTGAGDEAGTGAGTGAGARA